MRSTEAGPPVVIFGATEMALAAARSLARRGVRVCAVHFAPKKPVAAYSRCLTFVQGPDLDRDEVVLDFLLTFGRRFRDRPVLMPAQDHAVLFMHRHRVALREQYRLYVWESDVLAESGSKCGLRGVAERYQLPVPKTVAPRNRDDLEEGIRQLTFPCIVKPEFTMQWWNPAAQALGLSKKAIRVDNDEELRELYGRTEKLGSRVVIQQMVVGPDDGHMSYTAFVSPQGQIVAEMVAQKLRIHPPRFGVGCYLEAVAIDDARRVGREIIERLGFRGFTSLQFKRDERDGRLYLIEINLRFPIWIGLPIACGVDYPWYYYETCLGRSVVTPDHVRLGTRWIDFHKDVQSMRVYAREGTWTWGRWIRGLLCRPVPILFRWSDPMPAVMSMAERYLRRARSCRKQVTEIASRVSA